MKMMLTTSLGTMNIWLLHGSPAWLHHTNPSLLRGSIQTTTPTPVTCQCLLLPQQEVSSLKF